MTDPVFDSGPDEELVETVDGVPVLDDPAPEQPGVGGAVAVTRSATSSPSAARTATASAALPAVRAAAAAATGFVAGAATLALVKRLGARRVARTPHPELRRPSLAPTPEPRRSTDVTPVVTRRTYLVDVYLVAKPGE